MTVYGAMEKVAIYDGVPLTQAKMNTYAGAHKCAHYETAYTGVPKCAPYETAHDRRRVAIYGDRKAAKTNLTVMTHPCENGDGR